MKEPSTLAHRVELLPRSDGDRYRRSTLFVEQTGAITLNAHEMGASLEAAWGVDDNEVTLTVAPEHVARLALALAAEILKGGPASVTRLEEICKANNVSCRIAGNR